MPWIVGIDEAGYGPNLGPLVMTSVAVRVPASRVEADLWDVLRDAVRRDSDPDDDRLLIADSKVVYSPARGLDDLEHAVLAVLDLAKQRISLRTCLDQLCPSSLPSLVDEPWYSGESTLPVLAGPECARATTRFRAACREHTVQLGLVHSVVVCPSQFNRILDEHDTKGAVLAHGLAELLQRNRALDGDEPLHVFIDKHGGRNTYAAMLQDALTGGMIVAQRESMERSVYTALGLERAIHLTFQPRADAEHFCVALASMVSKYLREVLMLEFNRFWQQHVPDLKPTAGYPGDAARFMDAIRPAARGLGIAEEVLWRRR